MMNVLEWKFIGYELTCIGSIKSKNIATNILTWFGFNIRNCEYVFGNFLLKFGKLSARTVFMKDSILSKSTPWKHEISTKLFEFPWLVLKKDESSSCCEAWMGVFSALDWGTEDWWILDRLFVVAPTTSLENDWDWVSGRRRSMWINLQRLSGN